MAEVADSRMGVTRYSYDGAGRLLSVRRELSGSAHPEGGGAAPSPRLLDPATASTYPHLLSAGMAAGLPGLRDVTYSYDAAGNRLGRGEVINVMNQVTEDDFFTYAYDDNGNRSTRTSKATGAVERYWYDTEGHLIRYDKEAGGRLAVRARYLYDGYGRRLMKVADDDGEGLSPSEVLITTHEEDNVLATQWCAVGPDIISTPDMDLTELSIAPRWCSEYTLVTHQDKTLDQPLWITVSGTTPDLAAISGTGAPTPSVLSGTYIFHRDHLGSVIAITDIDGAVKYSFFYDAYGSFTVADGSGQVVSASALPRWVTLFTYTGREYDAESGLFHYRARAYDPEQGRFLQQDPVWQPNLYAYVGNNPVSFRDPTGAFFDTTLFLLLGAGSTGALSGGLGGAIGSAAGSAGFLVGAPLLAGAGIAALYAAQVLAVKILEKAAQRAVQCAAQSAYRVAVNQLRRIPRENCEERLEAGEDKFFVYINQIRSDGLYRRVGITQDINARSKNHANSGKYSDTFECLSGVSLIKAKAFEQYVIDRFGLEKNGGCLQQVNNSLDIDREPACYFHYSSWAEGNLNLGRIPVCLQMLERDCDIFHGGP